MVTKTNPDTITLEAADDSNLKHDGQANGTVTPGHLVQRDSVNTNRAEDVYEVTAHSTSDAKTAPLVATEYAKTGRGIDDDYSDGDGLEYRRANPGDRFYMFVVDGSSASTSGNANVSVGDTLVSAGGETAGTLRTGGTRGAELFEALEAVDNSGASSAARIRVEAI